MRNFVKGIADFMRSGRKRADFLRLQGENPKELHHYFSGSRRFNEVVAITCRFWVLQGRTPQKWHRFFHGFLTRRGLIRYNERHILNESAAQRFLRRSRRKEDAVYAFVLNKPAHPLINRWNFIPFMPCLSTDIAYTFCIIFYE